MAPMSFDAVIRRGSVYDGTGSAPTIADIAVENGKIVALGRIAEEAALEIDAKGLAVAPGFIDIHSHSDYTLLVDPRAKSAIFQGVTLEVIGNCGHGCFPLRNPALARSAIYGISADVPLTWSTGAAYLDRLDRARPAVNVVTLVPNGQLRLAAVGMDERPASADELAEMQRLLEEGLEAGAFGYSTGLEYAAEAGASAAEIEALCRIVARRGGIYATHTRYRDTGAAEAVEEAITTARNTGIRLQISHLLPRGGHDDCMRCLELVHKASADGQDLAFDMHTRLFGLTFLHTILPAWVQARGPAELGNILADAEARRQILSHRSILTACGRWDRVVLLDNDTCPDLARLDFEEIGRRLGRLPGDAALDILARAAHAPRPPMAIAMVYDEADQREAFADPLCVPASDATALTPDGPLAGSVFHGAYTWAAWFWRFSVREHNLLAPEAAIHKLTGQPAVTLGIGDRGTLRPGNWADIVVFDPATFAEMGTTFEPNRLATGVRHVLVNGVPALLDGQYTDQRSGVVIRRR
jgi:N-acyl-D-aspartate/D-glutamate deacylase